MGAETRVRTYGYDRMRAKAARMSRALREEVARAAEKNAKRFLFVIQQDIPVGRTGRLLESARAEPITGTFGTAWRVSVGDSGAYYARFVEFGTSGGVLGPQPAQAFFYPNYRSLRSTFRRNMSLAYRQAVLRSL
ncbi:MAG: HK97 gp10 family phage protein [Henriciella sp.]|nr:HK97 gp10 family phage protein [Henriciella sp.]